MDDQRIRDRFIEAIGNLGESVGLSRTVCQIYALLYITPEPLSPAQISRRLETSRGNVSINLKKLEGWNAVRKIWRKGYARSFYRANGDIEGVVVAKLAAGVANRAAQLRAALDELERAIEKEAAGGDETARRHYAEAIAGLEGLLKLAGLFTQQNADPVKTFLK